MAAKKTHAVVQKNARLINWQRLLSLIRQNQLQVVCRDSFEAPAFQSLAPQEFTDQIIEDQMTIQLLATKKRRETGKIIRSFTKAGIQFIMMKTLPYERILFRSPVKVPGDLDILLPVSEFYQAAKILMDTGYRLSINHREVDLLTLPLEPTYIPKGEEIFKKDSFTVELHTTLLDTLNFSSQRLNDRGNRAITNALYSQKQTVRYEGTLCYAFTPTALFLSLFFHCFYQHNYQSVIRYIEAAMVLRVFSRSIRWNYMWSFVTQYQCSNNFLWFLVLLEDIAPQSLPQHERATIRRMQQQWAGFQLLTYYIVKRLLFYPGDIPPTHSQKKFTWIMINKQLLSALFLKLCFPFQWLRIKTLKMI